MAVAAMAPTTVMPEMAFVPDMSGVWSCEGTLEISSIPRNAAIMNTNINSIKDELILTLLESFVYYGAVLGDEAAFHDLVSEIDFEFLLLLIVEVGKESADVSGEHL